jgi:flagellar hook-associated protein 2
VSVAIARDVAAVKSAAQGFVSSFNSLQNTLTALAGYNADSGEGGLLQGDFTVSAVENRIKSILRGTPSGVGGDLQRLSQIGITTQADGSLSLDSAALDTALAENLDGVAALFAATGRADDVRVSYFGSSDNTGVGTFSVNVTQAATRGALTGGAALPDFTGGNDLTIDAGNDSFGVRVDGVDLGTISLTQGVYASGDALAAEIQAQINGAAGAQSSGVRVAVTYSALSDSLTLTSDSYGADSLVEITSADANVAADLGMVIGAGTAGSDVAGTINGQAASGSGLLLTAAENTVAEGLELLIDAGVSGDLGTVSFGRGLVDQMADVLDEFLAADGPLDTRSAGLQSRIDDIGERRVDLERRLESIEARFRAQFSSLDTLLAQLQSTSDFLTQQLASLPGPAGNSNS